MSVFKKEGNISKIIFGAMMVAVFALVFGPAALAQFTVTSGSGSGYGYGYGYGYGFGYGFGNDGGASGYLISSPNAPVDLGAAKGFAILSYAGIANSGTAGTVITGNIGVAHQSGTTITGITCASGIVHGTIYASDAAGPTACSVNDPTLLTTALNAASTAYTTAMGLPVTATNPGTSGSLGGITLTPGVYVLNGASGNVTIPTNLTLSGSGSYVFQIKGTFKPAASVILTNGAQASDIVWAVSGATEIYAGAVVNGTILDWTSIAMDNGATLNGGAFGITEAVTLIGNTVTVPAALDEYGIGYGYGYHASGSYTAPTYAAASSTYTVTYEGNGSSGGSVPTDLNSPYLSGATVTVAGNTGNLVNSNGDTFGGWSLTNGGGAVVSSFVITGNTDLYPVWMQGGSNGGGGGGGGGGGCSGNCGATSGGNSVSTPSGVTLSGLQTQLLNLLVKELKVVLLQAQAQGMTLTPAELSFLNGSPATQTLSAITRDLTVGSRGSDVSTLQAFLIAQAKGIAAGALSSAGATGYFGSLTQAALAEYQTAAGITPASGYFGPITRAYLKSAGF